MSMLRFCTLPNRQHDKMVTEDDVKALFGEKEGGPFKLTSRSPSRVLMISQGLERWRLDCKR